MFSLIIALSLTPQSVVNVLPPRVEIPRAADHTSCLPPAVIAPNPTYPPSVTASTSNIMPPKTMRTGQSDIIPPKVNG